MFGLHVGDVLFLANGKKMRIQSIDQDTVGGENTVYSPAMDGDHTYYVNGILVHNKAVC